MRTINFPIGLILPGVGAIMLIAAWFILGSSQFIQGESVDRPDRVPQLYGYIVCLISLLWTLTSIVALIDNVFTLSAPAYHTQNQYGPEPSVTSFEAFRLTYDRAKRLGPADPSGAKPDTMSDADMRRRYETLRADRIAATEITAEQALVTHSVTLLLALGLFVFHWRWLRRRTVGIAM